ncbi:CDP-archaeol synthase [Methylosinus sp. Sm6]|uniref:CDP-archaeol synthase n=1 Tax=Methylosinus sp. Sm6 TaxID=2866948 RepID=UPI001C994784|nr:CDP-archaeol synthase [Methylosinus sp. Sm6]MBY6241905.1 CDP-archaeol synthase [Methylosinus sp. Sm6]
MNAVLVVELFVLLVVANGAPVLGKRLLGATGARPVDGGARFVDGRPLFGAAKTWRGILLSIAATTLVASALGLSAAAGAIIGVGAMAGDLFSSFVKRRLGRPVSSRALGLDQIPEALAPLLAVAPMVPLGLLEILMTTAGFCVGSLALSRLMFDLRVREQPF